MRFIVMLALAAVLGFTSVPVWADGTGSKLDASGNIQFQIFPPGTATTPGSVTLTTEGGVKAGSYVQIGDDSAGATTCTPDEAGKIRFNASTKLFEGCNGTLWNALGQKQGTWDGWCANGWGAVDQIGTPVPPAYYDSTPRVPCGNADENAVAAANGWTCRMGCSCPQGYQLLNTGTCNFGYCIDPSHGGTYTGMIAYYACMKTAQ